jgi:hypothetical protein
MILYHWYLGETFNNFNSIFNLVYDMCNHTSHGMFAGNFILTNLQVYVTHYL